MTTFQRMYSGIGANKVAFFSVFFVVVLVTYAILYALDFYPEPISTNDDVTEETALRAIAPETVPERETSPAVLSEVTDVVENLETSNTESLIAATGNESIDSVVELPSTSVLPSRIVIPNSDTDVTVLNPESLDMNDLDNALLDGVVRHPQSAHFSDLGNILIFGHSSYLPNVFNPNFQAFNGVENLQWGDEITLYNENGAEFTYRVTRVYRVKASETIIDNSRGQAKLTIVTCNSFGSKDDRYIVEANLVHSAA